MVSQKKMMKSLFVLINSYKEERGIREDEKVSAEWGSILQCWIADELKNYK